jgi:hypothetical protein
MFFCIMENDKGSCVPEHFEIFRLLLGGEENLPQAQ